MKQYAIIGIGRFGASIAKTLFELGQDVLAIDSDEERINEISDCVTHAVVADATDEQTLNALGIRNFDVAIVTIGDNLQSSVLICLHCKELGVPNVLAKAQNDIHARVLKKIGVDKVVLPERDMGIRLAHNLVSSNVLDFIELSPNHSLVEIKAQSDWLGKSLKELNMRVIYGINIIAIKNSDAVNVSPGGDDVVGAADTLVVIGSSKNIKRLEDAAKLKP